MSKFGVDICVTLCIIGASCKMWNKIMDKFTKFLAIALLVGASACERGSLAGGAAAAGGISVAAAAFSGQF